MAGLPARRAVVLSARAFAAFVVSIALIGLLACGTSPVGVDSCRRIEQVRCESAQGCGISLEQPVHSGDSPEQNVASCVRYYDDQCLHGLAAPQDPGPHAVDACVQAIIAGDCSIVQAPQTHPACAFLNPTGASTVDASADADASAP